MELHPNLHTRSDGDEIPVGDGGSRVADVLPDPLYERVERLAWEHNLSVEQVVTACCRYGAIHYEDALTER